MAFTNGILLPEVFYMIFWLKINCQNHVWDTSNIAGNLSEKMWEPEGLSKSQSLELWAGHLFLLFTAQYPVPRIVSGTS